MKQAIVKIEKVTKTLSNVSITFDHDFTFVARATRSKIDEIIREFESKGYDVLVSR